MDRRKTFEELVAANNGMLYKIGRSYTNDPADFEDLYQEMLVQLWQALPTFRAESKASTWLYRVCLNTALTHQRQQRKQPQYQASEQFFAQLPDESAADREQHLERERQLDRLYEAIYQLPQIDRAIILLHLEQKKYADIAHIMGLKANHVGVKISRIKKTLQQLLTAQDEG